MRQYNPRSATCAGPAGPGTQAGVFEPHLANLTIFASQRYLWTVLVNVYNATSGGTSFARRGALCMHYTTLLHKQMIHRVNRLGGSVRPY